MLINTIEHQRMRRMLFMIDGYSVNLTHPGSTSIAQWLFLPNAQKGKISCSLLKLRVLGIRFCTFFVGAWTHGSAITAAAFSLELHGI